MMRFGFIAVAWLATVGCQETSIHGDAYQHGDGPISMCGLSATDIDGFRSAMIASGRFNPGGGNEQFERFEDGGGADIVFTRPGHPAYPAVSCRVLGEVDGREALRRQLRCDASLTACDALFSDFRQLDEDLTAYLQGQ